TQALLHGTMVFLFTVAPFYVALASFGTYVLIDSKNVLDAGTAFVSLSLFNILRAPMRQLPGVISQTAIVAVSVKRINKFLRSSDLDADAVEHKPDSTNAIVVENAAFCWDKGSQNALENLNLVIPKGHLVAIVGSIGTGKSTLLSALLGELVKRSGRVNV